MNCGLASMFQLQMSVCPFSKKARSLATASGFMTSPYCRCNSRNSDGIAKNQERSMFFLALGQESNLFGNMTMEGENYGIKDPTESDIRRVIQAIAKGEQDLAILIKGGDEDNYIQTADGGRGRLLLEYQ